jgi:hypothetical protein
MDFDVFGNASIAFSINSFTTDAVFELLRPQLSDSLQHRVKYG